jgi:hypothetical protein
MIEFWARADFEDAAFRVDELRLLGLLESLKAAKVLQKGEALQEIECDSCGDDHVERVDWITEPPGSEPRAYISCPVAGPVRVAPERLEVWKIDFSGLAWAVSRTLEVEGPPQTIVADRLWLLGTKRLGNRTRDLFLARGTRWQDGSPLAEKVRLATALFPVILVPQGLPDDPCWRTNGRVLWSMSEFDWFGGRRADVLRNMTDILVEYDRRVSPTGNHVFHKEGQYWTITFDGSSKSFRDAKGFVYIAHLLRNSGSPCLAIHLFAASAGADGAIPIGSAGDALDQTALTTFKSHAKDLEFQLAQATRDHDLGRKEGLGLELEQLTDQILSAQGLGGKSRSTHDDREKIRKSVSMAIDRAIRNIREHHPALASHLDLHIERGHILTYSGNINWDF